MIAYMTSAEFAEARQTAQAGYKGGGTALSGYLSANPDVDQSVFHQVSTTNAVEPVMVTALVPFVEKLTDTFPPVMIISQDLSEAGGN